ncbi:MAG TPA: TetR/AcrR family transcriptional regulator [Solirubrobacteraceae bacterium]|jgi:AcrR family transcriptional regulator|nr:TetR/AcrR family transcriptional regulator [Solirubrobacteraceae bacterium]
MATAPPVSRVARRREREREIVAATRMLFDERGLQDAPIESIAREVGINKALIYRYFSSKEELYVLTLSSYLGDLAALLDLVPGDLDPVARLRDGLVRYTDFCLAHPAFLDCGLSLMRRSAEELREVISDAIWIRLGQSMAACLGKLSAILAEGAAAGVFAVEDPDFTANQLYAQTLGTMHLARIGVGVRVAGGVPEPFAIDPARVQRACVEAVLASVGAGTAA